MYKTQLMLVDVSDSFRVHTTAPLHTAYSRWNHEWTQSSWFFFSRSEMCFRNKSRGLRGCCSLQCKGGQRLVVDLVEVCLVAL